MTIENVFDELQKITKILVIAHSEKIDFELEKIASTDDRKKTWALIDGEHTSKQIAEKIGVSKRSVDRILKKFENKGFVNNPWGKPPTRLINYVPEKWMELLYVEVDES